MNGDRAIMEEEEQFDLSTLSENEQWLVLLAILGDKDWEYYQQWKEFEHQLVYENRFFSEHPIVHEIHNMCSFATQHFKVGDIFYRARTFSGDKRDKIIEYILNASGRKESYVKYLAQSLPESWKMWFVSPEAQEFLNPDSERGISNSAAFEDAWKKWERNVRFKGYNKKESSAPPAHLVPNGRVNPANIRYLYLSEDPYTPIYEIRPIISQTVSVATFKLKRDIVVYDLTISASDSINNEIGKELGLFNSIGRMFSKPCRGDNNDYLPTQFLAEEIKRMGFDGIRFGSSLHRGGVNIVLFNPDDCEAVSSKLIKVEDIKIEIKQSYFE